VLQCVAVHLQILQNALLAEQVCCSVWQCVAVCGSAWQNVAVCGSVLQCVAVRFHILSGARLDILSEITILTYV